MLKKLFNRVLVKFRLLQLRADSEIKKMVMDGLSKAERRETLACNHPKFERILDNDSFYRCTTKHCGLIINIFDVPAWKKEDFKHIINHLQKKIK